MPDAGLARAVSPDDVLTHVTPYIPPQCYTKTREEKGRTHNPCFVCHQGSRPPNYVDDAAVQLDFAFPRAAKRNPWTNLFVDRRQAVAATPDEEILAYVRQSNYLDAEGSPILARRLQQVPQEWDVDHNGRWDGWVPDLALSFDARGFDRRPDGSLTGWRAFAYYPFPGTFWPTNGSFGDVLIRLPEPFRQDERGQPDPEVYVLNLAILESLMARRDVPIAPVQEARLGVDLDGDGKLGTARQVKFTWAPPQRTMSWVGRARTLQQTNELHLAAGLFPEGTELAHTVRYLDVVDGKPRMAARLKELRYMVKKGWLQYGELMQAAGREAREAVHSPDKTRSIGGSTEQGIGNGAGWRLQGFIEDAARPAASPDARGARVLHRLPLGHWRDRGQHLLLWPQAARLGVPGRVVPLDPAGPGGSARAGARGRPRRVHVLPGAQRRRRRAAREHGGAGALLHPRGRCSARRPPRPCVPTSPPCCCRAPRGPCGWTRRTG